MLNNKVKPASQIIPSNRSFGFTFAGFFLLLAGIKLYTQNFYGARLFFTYSAVFALLTLCAPNILTPFNKLWAKLGVVLHRIMTPLIMGLLFFLVITPMGLVMRLFGWDPLRLRYDLKTQSYWLAREANIKEPQSMKNQF